MKYNALIWFTLSSFRSSSIQLTTIASISLLVIHVLDILWRKILRQKFPCRPLDPWGHCKAWSKWFQKARSDGWLDRKEERQYRHQVGHSQFCGPFLKPSGVCFRINQLDIKRNICSLASPQHWSTGSPHWSSLHFRMCPIKPLDIPSRCNETQSNLKQKPRQGLRDINTGLSQIAGRLPWWEAGWNLQRMEPTLQFWNRMWKVEGEPRGIFHSL